MLNCRFKEQEREEFELLGPPHPGEILREEVLPRLTISRKSLAVQLGISYSGVSRLLRERRRVTSGLAATLAAISGTSALYWLVLQAHHDAWVVQGPPGLDHLRRASSRKPGLRGLREAQLTSPAPNRSGRPRLQLLVPIDKPTLSSNLHNKFHGRRKP